MSVRAVCFVDMPFGKKADLASGVTVNFDHIYEAAIKPAIIESGLEPIRGDQERTGGIIHAPMFGRLLLSDYVVVDLMLSYRDVSAWDQMVRLSIRFPEHLVTNVMVRQQLALALNRRNEAGDRDRARKILEDLVAEKGTDPETLGLLGRVHKDRYKELKKRGSIMASAALDDAILAYTRGFESDPRDYYPGVNAVTLLFEKGDAKSLKEAERLVPLVSFAVARRGGSASTDYWDLATILELNAIGNEWKLAGSVLPRVLAAAKAPWMIETTLNNLELLKSSRERAAPAPAELAEIIQYLVERYNQLRGEETK